MASVAGVTLELPVLLTTMLPNPDPAGALAAKRTWTIVFGTVPDEPTVTVGEKLMLSVETSQPAGGVTKMPADTPLPETMTGTEADAVP